MVGIEICLVGEPVKHVSLHNKINLGFMLPLVREFFIRVKANTNLDKSFDKHNMTGILKVRMAYPLATLQCFEAL